jgi:hypothetical protein
MMVWAACLMLDITHGGSFWVILDIGGVAFSLWGYFNYKRNLEEESHFQSKKHHY